MTRATPRRTRLPVTRSEARDVPVDFVGTIEPNYYCRAWNGKEGRKKYCRARAGSGTDHVGVGRCDKHGGNSEVRHGRYSTVRDVDVQQLFEKFAADPEPLNVLPELALARALLQDFIERYAEMRDALLAWHESYALSGRTPPDAEKVEALRRLFAEYEELLAGGDGASDQQGADLAAARALVEGIGQPTDGKPREIIDVSDAIRYVDVISKVIDRVERARAANAISWPQLNRLMTEMGRVVETYVTDPTQQLKIRDAWLTIRP